MARHTETVMVKDGGVQRAVQVTVDAPDIDALDIPSLAQEAFLKPRRRLKLGNVTIAVKKFRR